MARQNGSSGCALLLGGLLVVPLLLGFAAWGLGLLTLVIASPAIVSYLLMYDPAGLHHESSQWILSLYAAPVVAYLLAAAQLPRRFRARLGWQLDLDYSDPKDRRARRRRRCIQTLLLLAVTNSAVLLILTLDGTASGPHTFT